MQPIAKNMHAIDAVASHTLAFLAFHFGGEEYGIDIQKPAPQMRAALDTDYLIGLGALDEKMLILVDIDLLMSSSEIGLIEKLAA
jgi:chemotaxis signal transduction protein